MGNVNNYEFSNILETVKKRMVEPQRVKVADAQKIMSDPMHQWKDAGQKKAGEERLKSYKAWLEFYEKFYDEGVKLCTQHETLVNNLSKNYDRWYSEVSNEGRQEAEMMSMQADIMQEIFCDFYQELKPLGLDIKQPQALNLK